MSRTCPVSPPAGRDADLFSTARNISSFGGTEVSFPHLLGVSEHTHVDSGEEDRWAGPEETEFPSCWTQATAPPPVPHFLPLRNEGLTDLQGPG